MRANCTQFTKQHDSWPCKNRTIGDGLWFGLIRVRNGFFGREKLTQNDNLVSTTLGLDESTLLPVTMGAVTTSGATKPPSQSIIDP